MKARACGEQVAFERYADRYYLTIQLKVMKQIRAASNALDLENPQID